MAETLHPGAKSSVIRLHQGIPEGKRGFIQRAVKTQLSSMFVSLEHHHHFQMAHRASGHGIRRESVDDDQQVLSADFSGLSY